MKVWAVKSRHGLFYAGTTPRNHVTVWRRNAKDGLLFADEPGALAAAREARRLSACECEVVSVRVRDAEAEKSQLTLGEA